MKIKRLIDKELHEEHIWFMHSPIPSCITDENARLHAANRAFLQLLKIPMAEIENRLLLRMLPAQSRGPIGKILPLAFKQKKFTVPISVKKNEKIFTCIVKRTNGRKPAQRFLWHFIEEKGAAQNMQMGISRMRQEAQRKKEELLFHRRAAELTILNQIAQVSNETLDLDVILSTSLKSLMKIVHASIGGVLLRQHDKDQMLISVKSYGLTKKEQAILVPSKEVLIHTKKAIRSAQPAFIADTNKAKVHPSLHQVGITSFLVIPVSCKGKQLGSINLASRKNRLMHPLSKDVLVAIGSQIGVAIENARLLREREIELQEHRKTEEELRKSEERYRILAEAAHDMIFIIDREDRVVYVNNFAASYFDTTPEYFIGKKRGEFFRAEISNRQQKALEQIFTTGAAHYFEEKTVFGPREVWIGTWLAPIFDGQGRVAQVLGVSRDIGEFKSTSIALEESERRSRDIIERSLDGYYFLDRFNKVQNINQAFEEMMDLKRADIVGKSLFDFADDATQQLVKKVISRVMGGYNIKGDEFFLVKSNDKKAWFSYNARRVIKDGVVTGMEGFIKNITEQKETLDALRRSEARYRALFDSIPYEVFSMDTEGQYREANRAFLQNWGDLIGKTAREGIPDVKVVQIINEMRKQVRKNQISIEQSFQVDREQGLVHYSSILCPVTTLERKTIGLVGLNIDVTEQTLIYERLKKMSMRLVQVQEEERARISREIHDSLGQYLAALQLEIIAALQASKGDPPSMLQGAYQTIKASIDIASSLCYTLRPPLLDDFGLVATLKDHVKEFEEKWHIPVEFHAQDIIGVLSKDVETALFRVTQEAFTNILKHSQAKRVELTIALADDSIVLTINDNGCGFDYQEMQKRSKSDRFGLITMKERIELLGGRFNVNTADQMGTKIIVEVPVTGGH